MPVAIMGENFNPERRTIKNNTIFLVTDPNGNIISNTSGYGLYTDDTRFLSRLELKINELDPILLSSSTEAGHSSVIISTNPILTDYFDQTKHILQETIQVKKESIIYGSFFETITISNYNFFNIGLKLELFFEADFLDIFEVRNIFANKKNNLETIVHENNILKFSYQDSTGATLSTEIIFIEEKPIKIENGQVIFEFLLGPTSVREIKYQIKLKSTASLPEKSTAYDFNEAFEKAIKDEKKMV
ncbi:MAG: glycogen debranching N-terminal domain-containing protein [bacterium]